ncbi:MAG: DUF4214 domain-containing protein [Acidimicrobiales bacterium]
MIRHVTRLNGVTLIRPLAALLSGFALTAAFLVSSSVAAAGYTGNAESANARFVVDGYQELLGRDADTEGLDFHLARLAAGGDTSRYAFAYSMLFSVEGSSQEVERAYAGLLSRTADSAGETYWTSHLQGHGVLDLRVLLMSSDEYWNGSGTSEAEWLEALYQDTLGRASDETGRLYWLAEIEADVPRPLIAAGLYLSDEALGHRVDTYYDETLSRQPTVDERIAAINTIRDRGERELRAELWASDEHFEQYLTAALS